MATTARQRIIDAVEHREPDRVPVDFGGSMKKKFTAAPANVTPVSR